MEAQPREDDPWAPGPSVRATTTLEDEKIRPPAKGSPIRTASAPSATHRRLSHEAAVSRGTHDVVGSRIVLPERRSHVLRSVEVRDTRALTVAFVASSEPLTLSQTAIYCGAHPDGTKCAHVLPGF